MQAFTTHSGIAAYLPIRNIDTDMIIPKQFLKTIKRSGLGVNLFDEMRYDADTGAEIADFVLNTEPYRKASILVAGENFGCGSSREHAPWALSDFGIRVIIAPSFADIFYNNCFKNGILPIPLPQDVVEKLGAEIAANKGIEFTVNLQEQTIEAGSVGTLHFDIDAFRKHCLYNGLDDIGLTLQKTDKIAAFEQQQQKKQPWLYRQAQQ